MKHPSFIRQEPGPRGNAALSGKSGAKSRHPLLLASIVLLVLATVAAMIASHSAANLGEMQESPPSLPATLQNRY